MNLFAVPIITIAAVNVPLNIHIPDTKDGSMGLKKNFH